MKRFTFLQVGLLAALLVTIVSCSTPRSTSDEYYEDAPAGGNVYYANPYSGGVNTIIVERDPYTGRYYQVSPGYYGGGYGARSYPYGYRNHGNSNRGYYNNNRNSGNNRNYNNSNGNNNGYYRTYPQTQQQRPQPQQMPAQRQQVQQQHDEAKNAILGPKRRN